MLFVIRVTLGFTFLLLGVAGLFLPVLQGWLFLLIALLLLFPNHHKSEWVLSQCDRRFPRIATILRRLGVGAAKAAPSPADGPTP